MRKWAQFLFNIWQISEEYLKKNVCWINQNISQISVDSSQSVNKKSLKTAMFRPNPTAVYHGYQPDISRISRPFVHWIS